MQVATANAAFLPLASSGFGLNQSTLPSRSLLDGGGLRGASIVTDQGSYDVGVGQRVRWGGGRYDVTWNRNRLESTNTFSTFNPSLAATASLTYTQPLLRGFRTDNERTQLVVARIDRISPTSTSRRPSSTPSPTCDSAPAQASGRRLSGCVCLPCSL